MECDRVFIILTRGPFPTGDPTDEQVESHLEKCSDCWRLAEALRPALDVFQEAVPAFEGRELPGYWGDARPSAAIATRVGRHRVAPTKAVRPETRERTSGARKSCGQSWASDALPAIVFATAITAAIVATILWLRG
jgi:hypothetical protein